MGATFPCLMLWSMWATQSLTQSHIQCAQPARAWIALRSYRHAYTNTNEHWTHTHTARSYIVRQPHTTQRPNGCWNAVMLVRLVHVWFTSFGYSIIESHTHTYTIYIFITNEMYYNSVENGKKDKTEKFWARCVRVRFTRWTKSNCCWCLFFIHQLQKLLIQHLFVCLLIYCPTMHLLDVSVFWRIYYVYS